jgi:hypothetical protein
MVKPALKIKFTYAATQNFKSAISYIRTNSAMNAEKIMQDVLLKIEGVAAHPARYPLHKYKLNYDGSY